MNSHLSGMYSLEGFSLRNIILCCFITFLSFPPSAALAAPPEEPEAEKLEEDATEEMESFAAEEPMTPAPSAYVYHTAYRSARDEWWKKPERTKSLLMDSPVHIAAGFRFMTVDLKENVKGEPFQDSFIGSINRLEMDQDVGQLRPYVQVSGRPIDWLEVGVGIGWDELVITTLDQDTGDGDVQMKARFIYLLVGLPNPSRFTPFMEIGEGSYRNSFRPLPQWSMGGRRRFDLENSTTRHLAAGLDIAIWEGLSLNIYIRQSDVEVDGTYVFQGDSRADTPFTFTTEHVAYGAGVQYVF